MSRKRSKLINAICYLLTVVLLVNMLPMGTLRVSAEGEDGGGSSLPPSSLSQPSVIEYDVSHDLEWLQTAFENYFSDSRILGSIDTEQKSINLNLCEALVLLSNVDPALYRDYTINIVGSMDTSNGAITYLDEEYSFQGLGSAVDPDRAFCGSFNFTTTANDFTINRALFNGITSDAGTNSALVISRYEDAVNSALFAEVIFPGSNGENHCWNIGVNTFTKQSGDNAANNASYSFAGIVGTLKENASFAVNVTNTAESAIRGTVDAGYFANTLEANSILTVNGYSGTTSYQVSAENGSAGAVVGKMGANSSVEIYGFGSYKGLLTAAQFAGGLVGIMEAGASFVSNSDFTMSGTIKGTQSAGGLVGECFQDLISIRIGDVAITKANIQSEAGAAGGLIGNEKDISLTCGNVSIAETSISANTAGGGLFGVLSTGTTQEYDLTEKYSLQTITFTSGTYVGGMFGELQSAANISVLNGSVNDVVSNMSAGSMGGVIGHFVGSNTSAINLSNVSTTYANQGTLGSVGGLIAIAEGTASGVGLQNVSTQMTVTAVGTNSYFGGLIAQVREGVFVNLDTASIQAKAFNASTNGGGLIGTMEDDSVLRMRGTIDLSQAYESTPAVRFGQLIGARKNTIVYALGDGSTETTGEYNWRLLRAESSAVADIGNYGEVIRLDGNKLTESTDGSFSDTDVIGVNLTGHTVSVYPVFGGDNASDAVINSLRDYVAASVWMNYNGTGKASNITLNTSVDLRGTGVVSMNRDNGEYPYSGIFDGREYTVTLAIGESYGVKTASIGAGQLYGHSSLGMFGRISNAVIKNLDIGTYSVYSVDYLTNAVNAGGLAGVAEGNIQVSAVNASQNLVINIGGASTGINVGGFLGQCNANSTISLENCKWDSRIKNNAVSNFKVAGYIGSIVSGNNQLTSNNCFVSGTVIQNEAVADDVIAGFIADGASNKNYPWKIQNLTVDGCVIENKATGSAGGLLGYAWDAEVAFENVVVANSELKADAGNFGGLVYKARKYWQVKNTSGSGAQIIGIEIKGSNKFSSTSDRTSAMLVADGIYDDTTKEALYLEIQHGAYVLGNGTSVSVTSDYFDELVAYSITDNAGTNNGVVSIGTESKKLDKNGINSYQNRLTGTPQDNPNTRYYYDLDNLKMPTETISTIDSARKLLCWSLYRYVPASISSYFVKSLDGNVTITGDIDLTGISYYPVSGFVKINEATILFDNETIESVEKEESNKQTIDSMRQHYMMQCGLFLDVINTASNATYDVKQLKLQGTVGSLGEFGSGALICGKLSGGNLNQSTLNISDLYLDGIRITGFKADSNEYAPLLINKVGSFVTLNLDKVHTKEEEETPYTSDGSTSMAATSLIGKVGDQEAQNIYLVFNAMGLDARKSTGELSAYGTYHSVFSHATFMESFSYAASSADNCSGTYHFTKNDEAAGYVTYGYEISNTNEGRNKGQQYYYFGSTEDTKDPLDAGSSSLENRFVSNYLRYVYNNGQSENAENLLFEIDVNQQVFDMVEGCGTYGDPYIIRTAGQLIQLRNFIQSGTASGWKVKFNVKRKSQTDNSVYAKKIESVNNYHDNSDEMGDTWVDAVYVSKNSEWELADDANAEYLNLQSVFKNNNTSDMVRRYLLNAYYLVEPEVQSDGFYGITFDNNFSGLGINLGVNNEATMQAFAGVIIGSYKEGYGYPTIKYQGDWSTEKFGGLVNVANGCVVKDLILDYSDANITINCDSARTARMVNNVDTLSDQKLSYFGGTIGYSVGGDNIVDNVVVKGLNSEGLRVTGKYNQIAAVGGMVGIVGGQAYEGGGVIFRNMIPLTFDVSAVSLDENSIETIETVSVNQEVEAGNHYYYWNPYVGRVLDGFACYEPNTEVNSFETAKNAGIYINNTDKNYTIPTLAANDKLLVGDDTIEISSDQQMWLLSAIANSGAGAMTYSHLYDTNVHAYRYGKVRTAKYTLVGAGNRSLLEDEIKFALHDELHAAGNTGAMTDKMPFLVRFYTESMTERAIPAGYESKEIHAEDITFTELNSISFTDKGDVRTISGVWNVSGSTKNAYVILPVEKGVSEINISFDTSKTKNGIRWYLIDTPYFEKNVTKCYGASATTTLNKSADLINSGSVRINLSGYSALPEEIYLAVYFTYDEKTSLLNIINNNTTYLDNILKGLNVKMSGEKNVIYYGTETLMRGAFISGGKDKASLSTAGDVRCYDIRLKKDIDLTVYGNGFRGVGGQYLHVYNGTGTSMVMLLKKSVSISGLGSDNEDIVKIKTNVNKHEYFDEMTSGGKLMATSLTYTGIFTRQLGLFNTGFFYNDSVIHDLIMEGTSTINWYGMSDKGIPTQYIGAGMSHGGVFGAFARTISVVKTVSFQDCQLKDFHILGGQYVGGFVGSSMFLSGMKVDESKGLGTISYTYYGNIAFTNCQYQNTEIEGDLSVGGFIGSFVGSNTTTSKLIVTDKSGIAVDALDSTITGKYSALQFDNGPIEAASKPKYGYALGVSGIVGSIFSSYEIDKISFKNVTIRSYEIVDNTDAGNGFTLGTYVAKKGQDSVLSMQDITVEYCKIEAANPEEISKSYYDDKCIFTVHCGGIYGYSRAQTVNIIGCKVTNTEFINGNYTGGICGSLTDTTKEIKILDCSSKYNKIYSHGHRIMSYVGTAPYGGICGSISFTATDTTNAVFESLTSLGNSIVNEGSIGGIVGVSNVKGGNRPFQIKNCLIQNNKLVSFGTPNYKTEAKNEGMQRTDLLDVYLNPNYVTKDQYGLGATGQVGGMIGTFRDKNLDVSGYNIMWKDNLIGYLMKQNGSQFELTNFTPDMLEGDGIDERNVGLAELKSGEYIYHSYEQATAEGMFKDDKSLRDGYAARWLGYANGATMQFVGLSCSGDYMPNANSGFQSGKDNLNANSYIVYADYEAIDPDDAAKNHTTIDGADALSPYVIVNSFKEIKAIDATDDSKKLTLTSDGVNPDIVKKIVQDYETKKNGHNNLIYGLVPGQISEFSGENPKYNENYFSTYQTAEDGQLQKAPVTDFPVLLIDSSMTAKELDDLIKSYISVLTNCNQTVSPRYTSIKADTYKWDYDQGQFVKNPKTSIVGDDMNKISVAYGQYDSGKSQFTVLDVQYGNPKNNQDIVYHLYIPIVVKKLLQYNFFAAAKTGTDYYSKYYAPTSNLVLNQQVISNFGDEMTAYIEYDYQRSKTEWEGAINNGEDCLSPYDKTISIGASELPAGTWLGLVDVNSGKAVYSDVSVVHAGKLAFKDMGWNSDVYLADMLNLAAERDANGYLVQCQAGDSKATVRVMQNGTYVYYKPYEVPEEGEEEPERYTIKVGGTYATLKDSDVVPLKETYYLTIITPKDLPAGYDAGVIIQNSISSVSVIGGSPTQKINAVWEDSSHLTEYNAAKTYNIGRFFKQELSLEEHSIPLISSNRDESTGLYVLEGDLTSVITLQKEDLEYINRFGQVTANSNIYHGYKLNFTEYNSVEKTSMSYPIPEGTKITMNYTITPQNDAPRQCQTTYLVTESGECFVNTGLAFDLGKNGDVKELIKSGATITARIGIEMTASGVAGFPKRMQDDVNNSSGIILNASSVIGFEPDTLARSSLKKDVSGTNHYYQMGTSAASLFYYAGEYDKGDGTGDVSQLGINPLEDGNRSAIIAYGIYNVSALDSDDVAKATTVRTKISLYQKQEDGGYRLVTLPINTYLDHVSVETKDGIEHPMSVADNCFTCDIPWEKYMDDIDLIEGKPSKDIPIILPTRYDVLTDWNDSAHVYANYRVELSAEMGYYDRNVWVPITDSLQNDYICYTNAKIKNSILYVAP